MNDPSTYPINKAFILCRLANALGLNVSSNLRVETLVELVYEKISRNISNYIASDDNHESERLPASSEKILSLDHFNNFFKELIDENQTLLLLWKNLEKRRKQKIEQAVVDDPFLAVLMPPVLELRDLFNPFIVPHPSLEISFLLIKLLSALGFTEHTGSSPLWLKSTWSDITSLLTHVLYTSIALKTSEAGYAHQKHTAMMEMNDQHRDPPLINGKKYEAVSKEEQQKVNEILHAHCQSGTLGLANEYFKTGYFMSAFEFEQGIANTYEEIQIKDNIFILAMRGHMFGWELKITQDANTPAPPGSASTGLARGAKQAVYMVPQNLYALTAANIYLSQPLDKERPFEKIEGCMDIVPTTQDQTGTIEQSSLWRHSVIVLQKAYAEIRLLTSDEIAEQIIACTHDAVLIAIQHCSNQLRDKISLPMFLRYYVETHSQNEIEDLKIILFYMALYDHQVYQSLLQLETNDLLPFSFTDLESEALFLKYPFERRLACNPRPSEPSTPKNKEQPTAETNSNSEAYNELSQNFEYEYWRRKLSSSAGLSSQQEENAFHQWVESLINDDAPNPTQIEWLLGLERMPTYFSQHLLQLTTLKKKVPTAFASPQPNYDFSMALIDEKVTDFSSFSPLRLTLWLLKYPHKKITAPIRRPSYYPILSVFKEAYLQEQENSLNEEKQSAALYFAHIYFADPPHPLFYFAQSEYRTLERLKDWIAPIPSENCWQLIAFFVLLSESFIEESPKEKSMLLSHPAFIDSVLNFFMAHENLEDARDLLALEGYSYLNVTLVLQMAKKSRQLSADHLSLLLARLNLYLITGRFTFLEILELLLSSETSSPEVIKLLHSPHVIVQETLPNNTEEICKNLFNQEMSEGNKDLLLNYLNRPHTHTLLKGRNLGKDGSILLLELVKLSSLFTEPKALDIFAELLSHYLVFSKPEGEIGFNLETLKELFFKGRTIHPGLRARLKNHTHIKIGVEDTPKDLAYFLIELARHCEEKSTALEAIPIAQAILQKPHLPLAFSVITAEELKELCEAYPSLRIMLSLYRQGKALRSHIDDAQLQPTPIDDACELLYRPHSNPEALPLRKLSQHCRDISDDPIPYLILSRRSELPPQHRPTYLGGSGIFLPFEILSRSSDKALPIWMSPWQQEDLLANFASNIPKDINNAATVIIQILKNAKFLSKEMRTMMAARLIENMPKQNFEAPSKEGNLVGYLNQIYTLVNKALKTQYFQTHGDVLTQRIGKRWCLSLSRAATNVVSHVPATLHYPAMVSAIPPSSPGPIPGARKAQLALTPPSPAGSGKQR